MLPYFLRGCNVNTICFQSLNTKHQKLPQTSGNGNRKKKISSKLEFDSCIFNNKAAEALEEKKKKPFSSFGEMP